MEKLIEMTNAGVGVVIYCGREYNHLGGYSAKATKTDDGMKLEIQTTGLDLRMVVDDLYERWVSATGRGLPNHSLKQIEYQVPPQLDDEIPF